VIAAVRSVRFLLPLLLTLLAVAATAMTGALYWYQYRPDRQADDSAARAAVAAASDGTVAVLSYGPTTFDHDFAIATSHLTGDFLSYYEAFGRQVLEPAAKQKGVTTKAVVARAAIAEIHPDSAVVLAYTNQTTRTHDNPAPTLAASSVLVTLSNVDGKWLISAFTPTG
jgi:Mce-associated membrane protein